jgi:2-methylcitrate dehydratase PrpD
MDLMLNSLITAEDSSRRQLTRRTLLKHASCILAVSALPRGAMAFAQPISPVMLALSNYMAAARNRALPGEVVDKTKQHILDTLAAIVSGATLPPGVAAIRFASSYRGEKVSTVVASNVLCGPIEAALTNGVLAHSDETDDSHAPSQSHPGCAIVPAALATGEQFGISGAQFVRAVALGYDIGTRVTMTLGGAKFQTESHRSTHALAGLFGAAAAAGATADLNIQQMRWLLDYTAQQASGIAAWQRDTDHIEKAFVFAGMPARSGVTAALLVQSGWTGVDDILSGPDNFFAAFAPQAYPGKLIDSLGERYEVTRTNIKKWTVGSPIQAPLDALQLILKKQQISPEQVQNITVRIATSEAAVVDNRDIPDICLQHMVAVMVLDGTVSFHSAHDKAKMQDPAVVRLRAKVNLVPDQDLDRLLPERVAVVQMTLANGTKLSERVDAVRGTAENPMTRDEVVAKSRDLISPVLGPQTCARLIDTVLDLENVKNVRELRPWLQGAGA